MFSISMEQKLYRLKFQSVVLFCKDLIRKWTPTLREGALIPEDIP